MSAAEMRRLVKHQIDELPAERLQSVVDFVGFIGSAAGGDLGSRPSFETRLAQARRDTRRGKTVSVSSLRRKYS